MDLIPPRTSGALETAPSLVFRDNDIGGTKSVLALFIVTDGGDGGLETEGVVIPGSLGITVRLRYGKGGHNLVLEGNFLLILHPVTPITNAGKTITGILLIQFSQS